MGQENLHRLKNSLENFQFEEEGQRLVRENKDEFDAAVAKIGEQKAYEQLILPKLKALFTERTGLGWRPEYNISTWSGKSED
jgi:hypothetical protein